MTGSSPTDLPREGLVGGGETYTVVLKNDPQGQPEDETRPSDPRIEALIDGGETYVVEFKSDQPHLSDDKLVKEVVCMANGDGGTLLLGVEDDGRVTGLSAVGQQADPVRIQALLMNKTMPPLSCEVNMVTARGALIAVIEIPKAPSPVGTRGGTYVRRALRIDGKPECVPYSLSEMISRAVSVGERDYALMPVSGLTWGDLDPDQFDVFRVLLRRANLEGDSALGSLSDIDIAKALRVVHLGEPDPQPLLGALLLFGRAESIRRFAPTHEVFFQVSSHTRLSVNLDLTGGLFSAAQGLFEVFRERNTTTELNMGLVHTRVPLVPEDALREAIANALIHRDYTQLGPVRVLMDETSVAVASPGGFVEGIRVDNILTQSKPRSPVLAEAFKRAGLVERSGLGVRRMFEAVLRLGRPTPDYSGTTRTDVLVRFDTSDIDTALLNYFFDLEQQDGRQLALADLMALQALKRLGKLTLQQAAEITQQSLSQVRSQLTRLEERGLVEQRSSPSRPIYHLSAATYRALKSPNAYVRIKGIDAVQWPYLVMDFVSANGAITRSQASSLCRITPVQATTLLRSMAADGSLELRGSRRGSHYVLPGSD